MSRKRDLLGANLRSVMDQDNHELAEDGQSAERRESSDTATPALLMLRPEERVPDRIALGNLRFQSEHQPRNMLDPRGWEELLTTQQNDPTGTLEMLKRAAEEPRPGSQAVLEHVETLAASIRSVGLLVPLFVLPSEDSALYTVVDGHCRAMAAVKAGLTHVPITVAHPEKNADDELTLVARRFLLNDTQRKLSPLEAAREVERLMDVALKVATAADSDSEVDVDGVGEPAASDVRGASGEHSDLSSGEARRSGVTRRNLRLAAAQRLVLERTGLTPDRLETLYRLRNLAPEARALADGLTENHLRALVSAPRDTQALIVQIVQITNATVRDTRNLCGRAGELGAEYLREQLQKVREHLVREPRRQRASVSWKPILEAVPGDLNKRLSALRAELEALSDKQRQVRLDQLHGQRDLATELVRALDEILEIYKHDDA